MRMKHNIASLIRPQKLKQLLMSNADDVMESICNMIISDVQRLLGRGLGWIIDPLVCHSIVVDQSTSP